MGDHSDKAGNGGLDAACRFGTRFMPNIDRFLVFHHISYVCDFDVLADALKGACAKVEGYAAQKSN